MITLYGFGPFLGTPDSSPFVIKAMMLLKLAGIAYRDVRGNPFTAPRRLLPYLRDAEETVADSTLIRLHLAKKYRWDFDAGLNGEQRAIAWAVERMCEDHLYFAMLDMRWVDEVNFKKGLGRHMFGPVPALVRPLVKSMLHRMNTRRLNGHGIGRYARSEIAELAIRDVEALAAILGEKPFLMGEQPCAADAFVFGIVTSILTPPLESPIRAAMQRQPNLVAYRDQITSRYFAESPLAEVDRADDRDSRAAAPRRSGQEKRALPS